MSQGDGPEPLPLSALNHLLFCERRCALIHVEGVFVENVFTLEGRIRHEAADLAGYETRAGVKAVTALPLYSRRFHLTGVADVIEFGASPTGERTAYPIEYKRGPRRQWDNDDVQLCAQALCLEEMMGVSAPRGAVFHASSKRRREVEFNAALRRLTEQSITRLHALIQQARVPRAVLKPRCEGCSLHGVCLPELSGQEMRLERLQAEMFTPEEDE